MWGDEDEKDSKEDLEEGDEGKSTEEKMEELSAKEDRAAYWAQEPRQMPAKSEKQNDEGYT